MTKVGKCQRKSKRFETCVRKVASKNGWTKANGRKHRAYAICTKSVCT